MMNFICTDRQCKELEGLAYWIADTSYIKERYGRSDPELVTCRKTIEECVFPTLDKLQVPLWVQNAVIFWAENWRGYKSNSMWTALKGKGIIRA